MKAATLARIARAQQQREALLVVTRLADGAQCVVDAAGCSGDLALAPEQAADAAALLAAGRSAGLAAAAGLFARAYVPAPRDDPALELALPSALFYIGALGSRRTHEKRLERLRAAGLGDLTGRIHSPIGLDLGGRAPAEIAVSILAEVIQVRYRGAAR